MGTVMPYDIQILENLVRVFVFLQCKRDATLSVLTITGYILENYGQRDGTFLFDL